MEVFNKNDIEQIRLQYKNGLRVKRKNKIFHQNIINIRKSGIIYNYSHEELIEYGKCLDINYFIDKYTNLKLYDFQKDVIKHFKDNKFSINMRSRQTGTGKVSMLLFIHEILFNINRSIIVFNNKSAESVELSNIFKDIYKSLPFFLQVGVSIWNSNKIVFENGGKILFKTYTKEIFIDSNFDIWFLNDFAKISNIENFYKSIYPIISVLKNCRLIISSPPNGMNLFYELIQGSESGENSFKLIKTYWWQVPNRDDEWKRNVIKMVGKYVFAQDYDLFFIIKK